MSIERTKVRSGGRLQMSARVRRELGLNDGDAVVFETVGGELRVRPYGDVLARVQDRLRKYVPGGASLSDELIADRRLESDRE